MSVKNRALFIDLLKGLALIIMVEVHVFNSLLIPSLKNTWLFDRLYFINGLVAPSFAFASGLVFVLSLQKSADQLRLFGREFWRKMSRIGLIFFVGYTLHLPYFSLTKLLHNQTQPVLESLYTVDILQLIATGLAVLLFARILFKTEKGFFNFTLAATVGVLVLSPLMWKIDFSNYLPLLFSNYFNRMHGSLFPVFPWWVFIFSGAFVAKYYIRAKLNNTEEAFARSLILFGFLFYLVSVLFMYLILPLLELGVRPSPFFFFERFGVILFSLGVFWFYLHKKENYKSLILDVSRESLLIYWLHLQLIYRDIFWGKSLVQLSGQNFNFGECLLVTIALIIAMLAVARIWGKLKKNYPAQCRWFTISLIGIGTIIFLFR